MLKRKWILPLLCCLVLWAGFALADGLIATDSGNTKYTVRYSVYNGGSVIIGTGLEPDMKRQSDDFKFAVEAVAAKYAPETPIVYTYIYSTGQYWVYRRNSGGTESMSALPDGCVVIYALAKLEGYMTPPTLANSPYTYNGRQQTVTLTEQGESNYYSISGFSFTDAGNYTVEVTPISGYAWSGEGDPLRTLSLPYTVNQKSITDTDISVSLGGNVPNQPSQFYYNAKEKRPVSTITFFNGISINGIILAEGENGDYTLSGTPKATDAGNYTVTITGKGNYTGSRDVSWSIIKAKNPVIVTAQVDNTVTIFSGDDFSDVPAAYSGLISPHTAENYPSTENHLPSSLPVFFMSDSGYSPGNAFRGGTPESEETYSFKPNVKGIDDQNYHFVSQETPDTLIVKPRIYPFTSGKNEVYIKGSDDPLIFRCTGEFNSTSEQFLSASVKALDVPGSDYEALTINNDYTAEEGSTIITLPSSYLKSKPDGNYDLLLKYKHGFSEHCPFRIGMPPPQTGDASPLGLYAGLAILSLAVILRKAVRRRRG